MYTCTYISRGITYDWCWMLFMKDKCYRYTQIQNRYSVSRRSNLEFLLSKNSLKENHHQSLSISLWTLCSHANKHSKRCQNQNILYKQVF